MIEIEPIERTPEEAMAVFTDWWDKTVEERRLACRPLTLTGIAKSLGIGVTVVEGWDAHLKATRSRVNDDFRDFLAKMKAIAFENDASPQDRRTYAQLSGWLTEKKEEHDKFEITHDDKLKIASDTIVGLQESYQRDGGVCAVCGKSSLLPNEVCVDTEQEHWEEGKVGAVAVPA